MMVQVSKRAKYWRDVKAGPRSFSPSSYSPRWNVVLKCVPQVHTREWSATIAESRNSKSSDSVSSLSSLYKVNPASSITWKSSKILIFISSGVATD